MAAQRLLSGTVVGLLVATVLCGCSDGHPPAENSHTSPTRDVTANTLPNADVAFVDRTVGRIMDAGKVPGILISISGPGKKFVAAYGVADTKTGRPLSPDDHFRVGSVTKTFVATAILQLVEEHKVSLDAPLDTYVAGVPGGDRITVRQLLQMRSGLPDYLTDQLMRTWQDEPTTSAWKHTEIVPFLQRVPANFAPGERFEYSNSNYVLLGMVVESVTHQTAEQVIGALIRKAGLKQTSIPSPPTNTELPVPFVRGYDYETGADVTALNPDVGWTAGNMTSTVGDLTQWSKELAEGALLNGDLHEQQLAVQPLDPANAEAAGYGLGIIQVGDWLGHGGSIVGYGNNAYFSPKARTSIVVMVNALRIDGPSASKPNELLAALAAHFFPGSYPSNPGAEADPD